MYFAASVLGKCQNRTSAWNKIRKDRSLQLYRIFCDEVFWCPQFWTSLSVSETAMPRCSTAFARKGCAPANRNWITFKFINFEGLLWPNKHTKNWEPTLDSLFEQIVELKIIFPKFPKANSGSLWGDIFNPHPEFLELCEVLWGWFPSQIPGFWEPILPGKTTSDDLMHQVASGNLKDILSSWTIRQRLHLHPETSYEQFEFGNWTNFFWKVTWESSENHVICIISSGQTELVDSGDFGRISWKNCPLEWGWVIISSLPRPSQLCKHTSRKNPSCTKPFSVVPSHQIPLAFDTFFFKTIVGRHHEIANSISFRHK